MKRIKRTLLTKANKLAESTIEFTSRVLDAYEEGEISEEDYNEILDRLAQPFRDEELKWLRLAYGYAANRSNIISRRI